MKERLVSENDLTLAERTRLQQERSIPANLPPSEEGPNRLPMSEAGYPLSYEDRTHGLPMKTAPDYTTPGYTQTDDGQVVTEEKAERIRREQEKGFSNEDTATK